MLSLLPGCQDPREDEVEYGLRTDFFGSAFHRIASLVRVQLATIEPRREVQPWIQDQLLPSQTSTL